MLVARYLILTINLTRTAPVACCLVSLTALIAANAGLAQESTIARQQQVDQQEAGELTIGGEPLSDAIPTNPGSEWIQLFNGNDLNGWTPKFRGCELGVNFNETFRATNGVLEVNYDNYDEGFNRRFGHLFYETPYSHYVLRVEYRFVGAQVQDGPGWAFRNNGLMLHGQDSATMSVEQEFPVSIEVQLLGGDGTNERPNLNVCTPGTNIVFNGDLDLRHCINSNSTPDNGDHWVTVEIEVRGNEIFRHRIDGETVFEFQSPQLDDRDSDAQQLMANGQDKMLSCGTISIQAESHPCEFRKIELRNLEQPAVEPVEDGNDG